MKTKSRLICFLLCLIFLIPISGCDKTSDAYIYFELSATPDTLDPQTASKDQELLIVRNIFEGLLRKDEEGKIVCGAAESYDKNGLTYTFKIRENSVWSNGKPLTAHDFVFALRRAVSPETNAPFVSRLFGIKGAEEIYNGTLQNTSLGVYAVNDKTLKIELKQDDSLFEETLTTSIAMPCNQEFFKESAGKYGLFSDNILSNSSYKITKWRKDPFGIRLYRNDKYSGNFSAKNAAVFITCEKEITPLEKLQKTNADMAFIDSALTEEATVSGLETKEFQNICWLLTLGDNFSKNMRTALLQLVDSSVYSNNLKCGYAVADSLFPSVVNINKDGLTKTEYNPENAKNLYNNELKNLPSNKFPADTVLYYYDDGSVKDTVTDIVGHWQNNLSAFINIESVSESALLHSQLIEQNYSMSIFPVKVDSASISEYLNKYGYEFNDQTAAEIQNSILDSKNIFPIMFQNTVIAHSPNLSNVYAEYSNGYIDFSFIIKSE